MTMPCPDPEEIAAYAAGALPRVEVPAFETHAADCRRCREALLTAVAAATPRPRTVLPRWFAAAAALLVLAGGIAFLHPEGGPGPAPLLPSPVGALRPGPVPPGGILDKGLALLAAAGAEVGVAEDGASALLSGGGAWLEVWDRPFRVEAGGASVCASRALLWVALPRPAASLSGFLLEEALAAGTALPEVVVLEGEVEVVAGGARVRCPAGTRLAGGPEAFRSEAVDVAAWLARRREALQALPVEPLFPAGTRLGGSSGRLSASLPARPAFRWVTAFKGRHPDTEVAFSLPVAGAWISWTAGLAAEPAPASGGIETVELAWDGAVLRGRVNGRLRFSVSGEEAKRTLAASAPGWGLATWGGSAEILSSGLK